MPRTAAVVCLLLSLFGCGTADESSSDPAPSHTESPADHAESEVPFEGIEGKTTDEWIADLSDADASVRQSAAVRVVAISSVVGLSSAQKQAAVPPLIGMLKEEDRKNRSYAAKALGLIGLPEAKPAVPALESLRDDSNDWTRQLVNQALVSLKAETE